MYRARDSKLKREVAIKMLPAEFSQDPERISRFQREAEVLASLNHPNIAAIYDLAEANGSRFLVLELVDGETLADRVSRGPIPIDEALRIAQEICSALEAAHEKGVVHRDLKPANVKITADGKVKVLDFGLAKALESTPANSVLSNSPTLSMAATNAGIVLGTAAYMSPEQAKGRAVDRRSDIFAFGCVLCEMLTGRPVFEGEDVTEIMSRVVTGEPDWNRLPSATPPAIRRMLQRALKKDPRQRLGDIRDARLEIEDALNAPPQAAAKGPAGHPGAKWIAALAVAVALIIALAVPTVRHLRETLPSEMRLAINTPSTAAPDEFALSPDGKYIAFIASGDGVQRLWLRPLDKTEAQPLPGTDAADWPFWSSDSRSIGFFATSKLYRIDIGGGLPQVVTTAAPLGRGGAWNADGTILLTPSASSPVSRVAASGGEPVAVTHIDLGRQTNHRYPYFLPDGRHFLFYGAGIPEESGLYLGSLEGGTPKRLTASDSHGAYLEPDMVVFVQQGALLARRLDMERGELTGEPVKIADSVGYDSTNLGAFSVSKNGIAYRSGAAERRQLTWFDRSGKAVGQAGNPDSNALMYPDLSPDGRRVALTRTVLGNMDIFLMDLLRGGSFTRFTFEPTNDIDPLWSKDGTQIVFSSNRKGVFDLYRKPSNGVGSEELLLESPKAKVAQDWSRDGRFLLYYDVDPKSGRDLWALDLNSKERKPNAVANTPFEESMAEFSPDGHFVAYQTNESGSFQIVVKTFPQATGKWQVSTGGGVSPRWRVDGNELYFIAPDGKLMAAPVTASGSVFEPRTPVALFQTHIFSGGTAANNRHQYAVSRDGRFLINQSVEESTTSPITLILNWHSPAR